MLVLAALPFLTTGCFDRSELEEQAFVITLGMEAVKPNLVQVVARLAIPNKLAGAGGAGGGGGSSGTGGFSTGSPLVIAKGRTIHEALALMNTGIERRINLSHLSALVFSEETAKAGLLPHLRTLSRYREFRRTHFMFITQGPVEQVMEAQKPVLEQSATRYVEDLNMLNRTTGFAPSIQVEPFLNNLYSPALDPILPIVNVNPGDLREGKKLRFASGRIERVGGNPVESVGTALFQNDKMVGTLDGMETRYLQLLNGQLKRLQLAISSPFDKGVYLSVGVRPSKSRRYEFALFGARRHITVWQNFEAELLGNQGERPYVSGADRSKLENAIRDTIQKNESRLTNKLLRQKKTNPLEWIDLAKTAFPTYTAYARFPWQKTLATIPVRYEVNVVLQRMGNQLSIPIAPEIR